MPEVGADCPTADCATEECVAESSRGTMRPMLLYTARCSHSRRFMLNKALRKIN
jgi:hypothetical protein